MLSPILISAAQTPILSSILQENPMQTLGDALPLEMARVRELITIYKSIGPAGKPAAYMMELSLQAADRASVSGDVVAMIAAYEDLKGYKE